MSNALRRWSRRWAADREGDALKNEESLCNRVQPGSSRDALQLDYRDASRDTGLVLGEEREVLDEPFERLVPVLSRQWRGGGLVDLAVALDRHGGGGHQVVVPGRVVRCAGRGRDDEGPVTVLDEHRRRGVRAAGTGACRGEDEQRSAFEPAARGSELLYRLP